jgi:serine/threonine-protein kinase
LIHRDIKPANLFVARKGATHDFLKVLDFGLVKRWDAPPDAAASSLGEGSPLRTAAGQLVGTPAFLAPEAVLGEGGIDRRVDIYALGCVAYWMLCGAAVFDATTVVGMVAAHVSQPPPPLAPRCPGPIGDELEALVMRCLEKEREERPSSARVRRAGRGQRSRALVTRARRGVVAGAFASGGQGP